MCINAYLKPDSFTYTSYGTKGMPLRCKLNDHDVHSFDFDEISWNQLKSTYKDQTLRMPCCDGKAIPKTSKLGNYFFAHKQDNCPSTGETEDHRRIKTLIAKIGISLGWDVKTEFHGETPDGERWIADVFLKKNKVQIALEVQWSPQSKNDFFDRQRRYKKSKVRAAWFYRLRRNGTYYEENLPFCKDTPVFGFRITEDGKSYEISQFKEPMESFVHGMLLGKLKWQPSKKDSLRIEIIPYVERCWYCKKQTTVILGAAIYLEEEIKVGFMEFSDLKFAEFIKGRIPPEIFKEHRVGKIKESLNNVNNTIRRRYISNGCFHCDALIENQRIDQRLKYCYFYQEIPKSIYNFYISMDELTLDELTLIKSISGAWFFEGRRSASFY